MRGLLNGESTKLEMQVCIPNGTWFGLGFGDGQRFIGEKMSNSELVFFFAGPT
jgi:hypothetical protein